MEFTACCQLSQRLASFKTSPVVVKMFSRDFKMEFIAIIVTSVSFVLLKLMSINKIQIV